MPIAPFECAADSTEKLNNSIFKRMLQNVKNFDIIFLELLPLYECYFPIAKKLDIPVVGTIPSRSLAPSDQSVGNSRNPATFPIEYTLIGSRMNFAERLFNLYENVQHGVHDYFVNKRLEKFYNEFYSDQNPHNTFISLLFSNSHEIFLPRTTVSNAIDIEGIAVKMATADILPEVSQQQQKITLKLEMRSSYLVCMEVTALSRFKKLCNLN